MNEFEYAKRGWLISDIHLGVKSSSIEWLNMMRDYFDNFFIPLLLKNKQEGDILFVLGDIFDNRTALNLTILTYGVELFEKLSAIMPVIIFPGNHDLYRNHSTEINSLKTLKWIPNITLYEEPTTIRCSDKNILIVPWVGEAEKEQNILEANVADYAFLHTEFIHMLNNNFGHLSEQGIDINSIRNYKRVYSGHIHFRQKKNNLNYIGSPYELTRSDIDNKKGIYLLDFSTNEEIFFENDYSSKHKKYNIEDILNIAVPEIYKKFNNNFIDIVLYDSLKININEFMALFPNAKELNFIYNKYSLGNFEDLYKDTDMVNISSIGIDNIYESIQEFIDEHPLYNELDKQKSKKLLKEVWNKITEEI